MHNFLEDKYLIYTVAEASNHATWTRISVTPLSSLQPHNILYFNKTYHPPTSHVDFWVAAFLAVAP